MEETLITFKTAKLAKEKGFELNSCSYYQLHKEGQFRYTTHIEGEDSDDFSWVNEDAENRIAITTQSLLQKWLREVYNLHCSVYRMNNKWTSQIYDVNKSSYINPHCYHHGYEEALEWGLQEALNLI